MTLTLELYLHYFQSKVFSTSNINIIAEKKTIEFFLTI